MQSNLQRIVVLELEVIIKGCMPLNTPYPAFLRQDNCNRFFFDKDFQRHFNLFRDLGKFGTAFAESRLFAEFFTYGLDFFGQSLPAFVFVAEQRLKLALFGREIVKFAADFGFFQFTQRTQLHVQNRFGLVFSQRKFFHHYRFGIIFFTDNTDNLVQIKIGNQISGQNFETVVYLVQTILRAAF